MRKQVQITAPWPTREEVATHLRISKAREKELQVFVDEFLARFSKREEQPANSEKRRKSASAA